jgi:hypothetical protein
MPASSERAIRLLAPANAPISRPAAWLERLENFSIGRLDKRAHGHKFNSPLRETLARAEGGSMNNGRMSHVLFGIVTVAVCQWTNHES